jgi:hypothetical protein
MRAAIGRLLFFDKLAEGMQTFFAETTPRQLALYTNSPQTNVPEVDLKSLARALCRYHSPEIEEIPEISFSQTAELVQSQAAIFNGEGKSLQQCVDRIRQGHYPEMLIIINYVNDGVDFPRLLYDPRIQDDLIFSALDYLFSQCGRKSSALARVRFEESGFHALEASFDLFELPIVPDWSDKRTLELFYYRISRGWMYRGYPVSAERIRIWVEQLAQAGFLQEAHKLLMYLQQYGYVTETTIVEGLAKKYFEADKGDGSKVISIGIQRPGKSEQKLAYRLRPQVLLNSIEEALPIIRSGTPESPAYLFCFDDCIGSGESIKNYLFSSDYNRHRDELVSHLNDAIAIINVIAFHADIKAIDRLESLLDAHNNLKVIPVRIIDESHRAFSETSIIFQNAERRNQFREFCERMGQKLFPSDPLGWDNCQWVIAYDYSIPDNSLPILFGSLDGDLPWQPLFERVR